MPEPPVVEHRATSVLLNPAAMVEGRMYPVLLGGHWLAVTKLADGSLDFYATAAPRSTAAPRKRE